MTSLSPSLFKVALIGLLSLKAANAQSVASKQNSINDFYAFNKITENSVINVTSNKSLTSEENQKPLNDTKFEIYTNTLAGTATIQGASNATVSIYDLSGQLLFAKKVLTDNEEIDLSALPSGVYYAQVKGLHNASITKKIMK